MDCALALIFFSYHLTNLDTDVQPPDADINEPTEIEPWVAASPRKPGTRS